MDPDLIETLRLAQRLGFFGARPIEEAAQHAQAYVEALDGLPSVSRLVDLGSGGGLPALVIATELPAVTVTMVDRRSKRTDFLLRAVNRLGLTNAEVRCDDAQRVVAEVASGALPPFDAATARGFGPPELTLRLAAGLITVTGAIVISEPPQGERWDAALVAELGLQAGPPGRVRVFRRFT